MFRNTVLALALSTLGLCTVPALGQAANAELAKQWVAYGQKLYAARDYDKAVQAFSTAARADSADAGAWRGLGNALYAKKDYANALKYYKYALQLNPADTGLQAFTQKLEAYVAGAGAQAGGAAAAGDPLALANQYYAARQYDQAIQQYNAALAANPNNDKAYQGLGNCYYAKGNKPSAVAAYKRALQINPGNTQLAAFLARYAPEAAQSTGVQVANGPKDWVQPLWRSAILPGWGQFYNGDSIKGWVLGGLTLGSLIGSGVTYRMAADAREKYNTADASTPQSEIDAAYNTWDSMGTINNTLGYAFLALYTFNLVDAIISAKPSTHAVGLAPGEQPPVQLGLLENGTMGAKVRLLKF